MPAIFQPYRRRFLQRSALALGGCSLSSVFATDKPARPARAKACILLYMDGGPSHIDLFDLKPDAPAEIRGPYQSIATSVPGIRVGEHLPRVAQQMHQLMQIRSVRHEQTVHDPAVYQMLTGYRHISTAGGLQVEATDLPHIASAYSCADRAPAAMPKAIQLPDVMKMQARVLPGQSAGILGPAYDPFAIHITHTGQVFKPEFAPQPDLTMPRLESRSGLLAEMNGPLSRLEATAQAERLDTFQQQALAILASSRVQTAFDIEREPPAMHDRYGRHRHGQSVLLARRLVEAGAKFVTVYWGNEEQDWANGKPPQVANNPWDTHRNHFPLVADSLAPRADQALAALLADLSERGRLDETLVVWMGDFGRTPRISKPWASRDHWPHAFTVLMAGAGIRGGAIHGRTDRLAAYVEEQPVSPADLTATIVDTLGIFPGTTVAAANGARHRLSTGRALDELFA